MVISHRTIQIARRRPGRTAAELADLLGLSDRRERNRVSSALYRAVRDGLLVADDGAWRERRYYPTDAPWSPTAAAEARRLRGRAPEPGAKAFAWRGKVRVPKARGWRFVDKEVRA